MAKQSKLEQVADVVLDRCLNLGAQFADADALIVARAAIEAMRMPTKAMIEAAYAPTDDLILARFKWEAMLNAALR